MSRRPTEMTLAATGRTWNDAQRIAEHRALSPAERVRRTIEVSHATLRFAQGPRTSGEVHRPHIRRPRRVGPMVTVATPLPPFWSLVEAHGDELLAHARRLAPPGLAEDVLQEALLRALRGYPRLRHAEHLRAWLYRITTTTAIDHHRNRRRELPSDDVPVGAVDPEFDDGGFEALIAPLTPAAQAALRLRFVEDLDYEGIARRLDCSPQAARQRVSTAIRLLRSRVPA